jgi:hypothetical protein
MVLKGLDPICSVCFFMPMGNDAPPFSRPCRVVLLLVRGPISLLVINRVCLQVSLLRQGHDIVAFIVSLGDFVCSWKSILVIYGLCICVPRRGGGGELGVPDMCLICMHME